MDKAILIEQLHKYYALWRETNYVYEEWAKAHGLSDAGLFILFDSLEQPHSCTQKNISKRWLVPKQTINMALKDFERKGFVQLLPMPEDKRNKLIHLTEAGREYATHIISELRQTELTAIAEIGVERMEQLNDTMALFIKHFSKNGDKMRHDTKI